MKLLRDPLLQIILLSLLIAVYIQANSQNETDPKKDQPKIMLGVLEDHPGVFAGDPHFRAVRVMFEKIGDDWRAFPYDCSNPKCLKSLPARYPKDVMWTIAFDGRNLGRISAHILTEFSGYDSIGYQKITSQWPVPTIGKQSEENSGFLSSPVYRPLVAVSFPYFKDPYMWKPTQLSKDLIDSVRQQFRQKFPKVINCQKGDGQTRKPWKYKEEEIKVIKAFSSKHQWCLVNLVLTGWACDAPQEDTSPFAGQWFLIDPSGGIKFLAGDMGVLVDAGDYDNDGKSEILFTIDGYNLGGYRLFYQDFNRSIEFLYHYH